ncbi:hypothetical protein C4D60_Mb01t19000 [Musa balbisiana]|uniref:Uncharacterized protein n=1 Tax=Musa balbisiana TaxID=52838 RepID=A0A4S8JPL7_MUSBA|nr:hypothetical protein C4D60_Mb01t19000 [Musa balbisiana]
MTTTEVQNIMCELNSSRNTNYGIRHYQKYDPSLQTGKSGSRVGPNSPDPTPVQERRRSSSPLNDEEGNPRPEKPNEPRRDPSNATLSNFEGR